MNTLPLIVKEMSLEERSLLWDWQSEPLKHIVYKLETTIPTEKHRQWFSQMRSSQKTFFYFGYIDILRMGLVRFDQKQEGIFEAQLYIKPTYCGKGHAPTLLLGAVPLLQKKTTVTKAFIRVPNTTSASTAQFEERGFLLEDSSSEYALFQIPLGSL